MADLVIVPASVGPVGEGTLIEMELVGEACVAGDALYYDSTQQEWMKCDCTDPDKLECERIALGAGSDGVAIPVMLPGGEFTVGVATIKGALYVLSVTGNISPVADLTTGDYTVIIGWGTSTDGIFFEPRNTGELWA